MNALRYTPAITNGRHEVRNTSRNPNTRHAPRCENDVTEVSTLAGTNLHNATLGLTEQLTQDDDIGRGSVPSHVILFAFSDEESVLINR